MNPNPSQNDLEDTYSLFITYTNLDAGKRVAALATFAASGKCGEPFLSFALKKAKLSVDEVEKAGILKFVLAHPKCNASILLKTLDSTFDVRTEFTDKHLQEDIMRSLLAKVAEQMPTKAAGLPKETSGRKSGEHQKHTSPKTSSSKSK